MKQIYILGNHVQALGISRIAKELGLKVTVFNNYRASITRFSNSCNHFKLFKSHNDLLSQLNSAKEKDTLIMPTNDNLVHFISENYEQLKKKYYISLPEPDIINICYNKIETYKKAIDLGIPIPKSYFPSSLEHMNSFIHELEFPLILKPAVMHTFHKKTGQKVFLCKSQEELINNYHTLINIIPPEQVIIQEFLTGGAKSLFSFGSFFSNKKVFGSFIVNRIRQKPMDFGISTCFAKSVINMQIEEQSIKFLKGIDYFGLSEVEFMYDKKSNQYKLLEINPRTWKWHSISNILNINLIEMLINHIDNKPFDVQNNNLEDIAWIERVTDSYVSIKEIIKGKMTLKEYIITLKMPKENAVWSFKDPLPAIMYILLLPYLFLKRN
jgi:predicted ATP-grasp superfamily ATP-dependent carboligase